MRPSLSKTITSRNGMFVRECEQVNLMVGCRHYISQEKITDNFPILDILGYLKNTHKNPKFGRVRQIPIREFPTKFPNWDLSHPPKFGIFVGIL